MLNATTSLFGAVLVTQYYKRRITFSGENKCTPNVFKLYWLLSNLSTTVCIALSCVYWPLLYVGRDKGLNDSLTHAGNAIVLLVDIFIVAHPPRYGHFIHPLMFGILYGFAFSLPYTLLGGTDRDFKNFIYSVLDWRNNANAAFTFALSTILFLVVMHFIVSSLGHLRIFLHQRFMSRKSTVQSTQPDDNHQTDNPSFSP